MPGQVGADFSLGSVAGATEEGEVALSVFREEGSGGEKMPYKIRGGDTCCGRLSDKKSWVNVRRSPFFCFRVGLALGVISFKILIYRLLLRYF